MRYLINILDRASKIILILLLLLVISLREGSFLGKNLIPDQNTGKITTTKFTDEDIRKIFNKFTRFVSTGESVYKVFENDNEIGVLLNSSPKSDSIYGYVNTTPLLIGIDIHNKIKGIQLLKNHESSDFVEKVKSKNFLNTWNKLDVKEATDKQVDAVAGATFTSTGIKNTVKHTLSSYGGYISNEKATLDYISILKWTAAILLLFASLAMFFFPAKMKSYRTYLMIALVCIIGFWLSNTLSTYVFYNVLINGLNFKTHWFLIIIMAISILIPLFTGKSYYCHYLCPYGSAQELAGKITHKKIKIPIKLRKYASQLKDVLFAILVFLLVIGVSFDLTDIEPFTSFVIETCTMPILIMSISFIILSIFTPRPWCNYFCPTGTFLEIFRKLK